MASSLFPNNQRNPLQMLNSIKAMANGNPQAMFNQMLNNNPEFAKFVNENKGLSPEQIAKNYGVDLSQVEGLFSIFKGK